MTLAQTIVVTTSMLLICAVGAWKLSEVWAAIEKLSRKQRVDDDYQHRCIRACAKSIDASIDQLGDATRKGFDSQSAYIAELFQLTNAYHRELVALKRTHQLPSELGARVALLEMRLQPEQSDQPLQEWADSVEGECTVAGKAGEGAES